MSEFNYNIVKNPKIFQENRLPAHSDHEFYDSEAYEYGENSSFKYSLNGSWKFSYAKNYESCNKEFYSLDCDCKYWNDIRVPGHIQTQGYDKIMYVNTQYPWDGHEAIEPGEIPEGENPVASYVKYLTIPKQFEKKPLYISFQGVESGFALWMNGKYVGYSEDSFTPAEFNLTPFVVDGENKIAVQVFKWTSGSWCEDQDFFRFSGIFRDVYLYTIPSTHVRDLKIKTLLDEDYKDAELVLDMDVIGAGHAQLTLSDEEADLLNKVNLAEGENHVQIHVRKPRLWSAEDPYLFDLKLLVFDENGKLSEVIKEKVGFRSFEMKDNMMHINGKRIVFKGVNRHEFSSETGRCISEEDILKDIITIKQNNINAIRCSHYPNQTVFYRLCDIFGIYVIDETNLETHGTWQGPILINKDKPQDFAVPGDRPEYTENVIDRAHSMYERDKNHPCVLIWSLGNESYGGSNLLKMHDKFKEWDDTRLVHYEGIYNDRRYPDTSDIESTMYAPVSEIREWLSTHREKPYINCEYMHAMGNSCGAMEKYTEYAYEEPLFQGGFIWDYIDQAITTEDRYGVEFEGYGGDFDDRPNDGSFSGDGICYSKDRLPSPKMQEVKADYQNIKITIANNVAHIENRNLFLNTDAYKAVLKVERTGEVILKETLKISCPPLESVDYNLGLDLPKDDEYVITLSFVLKEDTIWAKNGHEVAWGQTQVGTFAVIRGEKQKLVVTRGLDNIGVRGDNFEILFSETAMGLSSYKYAGKELLKKPLRPNFWRAMTENDVANQLPYRAGQWKIASKYMATKAMDDGIFTRAKLTETADSVSVEYTYFLATKPLGQCHVKYIVEADGMIRVDLTLDKSDEIGELPELSLMMVLDADYENLEWYGRGPEETYNDKCHAKLGVYKNKVADNLAKYLVPQESGNKQDVRYAKLTNERGEGILLVTEGLGLSVLPYSPHEIEEAMHHTELPPVHYSYIRVGKQMGIAGDNTWGAKTHPEYMLDNSKDMHISFMFKGI